MRLETNSPDRKLLARAIGEWLHEPVHYDGAPTMAFSVGSVKVDRDAVITCDDADTWAALTPFFQNNGLMQEEEAEQTVAEQEESETENITVNSVSIPADDFTVQSAVNLLHTLYARQNLLNAMTGGDTIFVDDEVITLLSDTPPESMEAFRALVDSEAAAGMIRGFGFADGKLTIDFPRDEEHPENWQHYAMLMLALAGKAKAARRVNKKRITPDDTEMKYFCNGFLNQLGFGGEEHKELRHVLLGHLHGYAAFKNTDKMETYKARFIERRRALRQSEGESHGEAEHNEADR